MARRREHALVDPEVVAIRDRLEVVELDVGELDVTPEGRIGLRQEVGLTVSGEAPRLEHERREPDVGWIGTLGGTVADIGRHELEVADAQRLERALVDVGDVAVANLEMVDLQWVDGL